MFDKGAYIVHQSAGVCEIMDVATLDMEGAATDRLYYILRPCYQKNSKVFIPVDREKTVLRAVMTGSEASDLIDNIPDIEELWIANDKLREAAYKEAMRTCDCRDLIRIIKALYLRKRERLIQGKKISSVDEKYLRMAEENLYSELSIIMKIPKENMEEYITDCIEHKED